MDKNILVIGASSGYGKNIATHLQSCGFNVVGASRSILKQSNSLSLNIVMDVMETESVQNAIKQIIDKYSSLYAVIYCAGIAKGINSIKDGNPEWWNDVFQTNTLGLLKVIKYSLPYIEEKGTFIHIGSISSKLNYFGGADYCASKAASSSIMKNLRLELAGTNIRSMSIEPGYAKTNFMLNRFDGDEKKAEKSIIPLNTQDLANLIEFILKQSPNVNFDEIFIKPIEQIIH